MRGRENKGEREREREREREIITTSTHTHTLMYVCMYMHMYSTDVLHFFLNSKLSKLYYMYQYIIYIYIILQFPPEVHQNYILFNLHVPALHQSGLHYAQSAHLSLYTFIHRQRA